MMIAAGVTLHHHHHNRPLTSAFVSANSPRIKFKTPTVLLNSSGFNHHDASSSSSSPLKISCSRDGNTHNSPEEFSVLKSDFPFDSGSIWSTTALYILSLHIPLSFGGLSIVSQTLHQPVLDPQIQASSLLGIQMLELLGVFLLLRFTAKSSYYVLNFSGAKELSKKRNWLLASALGFGFLLALLFLTSFLADMLIGPKAVNNPLLKEILSSGSLSVIACTLVYCVVTPFLEEIVYRGFLLTSLASMMDWQQAVLISSAIFSASHLSVENFIQLFIIGYVLGCSYCWTGKLRTSFVIHSLYNALTLYVTFTS